MSLTLRESFQVRASPQRVWAFLTDPARVVQCLPGAELIETVDEQSWRGRVKVRVGPISTAYDGTARLTEVDEAAQTMRLIAEGKEMGATGSARMSMLGTVAGGADGESTVEVDATIDIAGRVMQFGRGLVESVSRQLFKQFVDAVRDTLEDDDHGTIAVEPGTANSSGVVAVNEEDAVVTSPPALADKTATRPRRPAAPSPAPRELRIVPLLFRAIADWLRRLFGR